MSRAWSTTPTTNFPTRSFSSTAKEFPGYGRYVLGAVGKVYNRRQELPEGGRPEICHHRRPQHEDPAVICAQMAEANARGAAHKVGPLTVTTPFTRQFRCAIYRPRPALVYLLAKGDDANTSWQASSVDDGRCRVHAAVRQASDERAGRGEHGGGCRCKG